MHSKNAHVPNPAAVELGRLGGLKGGKARAAKLSPERRRAIAIRASNARWNGRRRAIGRERLTRLEQELEGVFGPISDDARRRVDGVGWPE